MPLRILMPTIFAMLNNPYFAPPRPNPPGVFMRGRQSGEGCTDHRAA